MSNVSKPALTKPPSKQKTPLSDNRDVPKGNRRPKVRLHSQRECHRSRLHFPPDLRLRTPDMERPPHQKNKKSRPFRQL